jgi:alpha-galactosidase
MDRREFLRLSSGAALSCSLVPLATGRTATFADALRAGQSRIVPVDPSAPGAAQVEVSRQWDGDFCRSRLTNHGKQSVRVKEILLSAVGHDLPPDTRLYGESFQMLSQTAGTLAHPIDLGYSETSHYKIPHPEGVTAISGLLALSPANADPIIAAFTSCRKFIGRFYIHDSSIDVVVDTEGLELAPGETWELEELMVAQRPVQSELLARLATRIAGHHPQRLFRPVPTGWCSWYCFGPRVTAQQVLDNLDVIAKDVQGLKYIQIDDGYQPAMGDWLETGKAFGGDVSTVLKQIRLRGFEPAIWVAPFIAEENSHLFQQHPDWFIQNADGKPLPSNQVTFGGWRHGPWYAMDGTHPEVQKHFEELFRTMRRDWGCTYFKLDANFWGAMHGGRFHDPAATRIEAYRRGMEAVRRGAGDGFILGCNHPIWPSFGLIDGSRSSGDIKRSWATFAKEARQTLLRNWQNGRVWWNDPDAVLLTGDLSDDEYQFHATAIYASGGMVLSGDDLTKIPPNRLAMLRKLLPPTGIAAAFQDDDLRIGLVKLADRVMICLFNWDDAPQTISVRLPKLGRVTDFWDGKDLGRQQGVYSVKDVAPHSARLLICK